MGASTARLESRSGPTEMLISWSNMLNDYSLGDARAGFAAAQQKFMPYPIKTSVTNLTPG
jgi:hypothetical protein